MSRLDCSTWEPEENVHMPYEPVHFPSLTFSECIKGKLMDKCECYQKGYANDQSEPWDSSEDDLNQWDYNALE
tara:strand:+ start:444 stop:662 length:219 start_codon:yes stop_codon:yes gene_type:complete